MPRCFIQRCSSSGKKKKFSPNIIFHVFPNRLDKIKMWLLCIQENGQEIGGIDDTAERILEAKRGDRYRICSEHFTEDCYVPGGLRKTLKRDAVPSVFQGFSPRGDSEPWVKPPRKRAHVDPFIRRQRSTPHAVTISPLLFRHRDAVNPDLKEQPRAQEKTDKSKISENIFNLTLEIMCLLTGEDCIVVKQTSGEKVAPLSSPHNFGALSRTQSPVRASSLQNEQKILELTFRIIQQLTGEDPIKRDDAAISFCMDKAEAAERLKEDMVASCHMVPSPGPFVKKLTHYKSMVVKEESPLREQSKPVDTGASVLTEDARCRSIFVKEEPSSCEGGNRPISEFYTTVDPTQQYSSIHIKPELGTSDGARAEASTADHVQYTSVRVKEEPSYDEGSLTDPDYTPNNEFQYTSFQIKEESVSDEERTFADTDAFRSTNRRSYTAYSSDEETDSCEEGISSKTTDFTPVNDSPQYPSTHSENATYGGNHLQNSFLIFDEGSSFDTDVSALIKHAHTKYSFAPIEEGSGSDEGEAVATTDAHISKDRPQPKSSSGTDEAATGEEGSPSLLKKDYTCSECSEIFVRRSDFANHRRNHRRERLTCPECGKLFSNKPSLLNHLTGHTGEKPYSCPICGKCFTRNSNLIVHQAIHMERSPLGARNVGDFLYIKPVL